MKEFLKDKIMCNDRELYEVFERFDWKRNGRISQNDFVKELMPIGKDMANINTNNHNHDNNNTHINTKIQSIFIAIFI